MIKVDALLTLSTSHLLELDLDPLAGDFGSFKAIEHDKGYIVFVPPTAHEELCLALMETPEWLRPCIQFAWRYGAKLINFTTDGQLIRKLPVYDEAEQLYTDELIAPTMEFVDVSEAPTLPVIRVGKLKNRF